MDMTWERLFLLCLRKKPLKKILETTLVSLVEIVTMYKVFLVNEGKEMTRAGKGARWEGQEPE